ncbi:hypothetical protein [Natronospira sp.]|uniref:hypothetical protein n=1 Tax=Natronospira sp. TaxID=2024970 RepID=UPI003872EABD
MKDGFNPAIQVIAVFTILIGLFCIAQASAASVERVHVCSQCVDGDAAFEEAKAIAEVKCEAASGGASSYEDGYGEPGLAPACSIPDETLFLFEPDQQEVYAFDVHYSLPGVGQAEFLVVSADISLATAEEIRTGWGLYLEYLAMIEDVEMRMAEFLQPNGNTPSYGPLSIGVSDSDEIACPSGTALEALGDHAKLTQLKEQAVSEFQSAYEDRLSGYGVTLAISGGWLSIDAGPLGAGLNFDLEREESIELEEHWRAYFDFMEDGSNGWASISDDPDFLAFRFVLEPSTDGELSVTMELDPSLSRVHGEEGWLTEPHDRSELDDCSRQRLEQAVADGQIIDPNSNFNFGGISGVDVTETGPHVNPGGRYITVCYQFTASVESTGEILAQWVECATHEP